MKLVLPLHGDRISPLFDVAKRFVVVELSQDKEVGRTEVAIEGENFLERVRRIVDLKADVLICGAISWQLEAMLVSAGIKVFPNTCGLAEEVIAAFIAGNFTDGAFLMPGCMGRRHRHRCRRKGNW